MLCTRLHAAPPNAPVILSNSNISEDIFASRACGRGPLPWNLVAEV
jgi:hypothetical protein